MTGFATFECLNWRMRTPQVDASRAVPVMRKIIRYVNAEFAKDAGQAGAAKEIVDALDAITDAEAMYAGDVVSAVELFDGEKWVSAEKTLEAAKGFAGDTPTHHFDRAKAMVFIHAVGAVAVDALETVGGSPQ